MVTEVFFWSLSAFWTTGLSVFFNKLLLTPKPIYGFVDNGEVTTVPRI